MLSGRSCRGPHPRQVLPLSTELSNREIQSREPRGDAARGNRLLQVASPTAMQSGWFFQIPPPSPSPRDSKGGGWLRDSVARAGLRGVLETPGRQPRTQVVPAPSRGRRANQASTRSPGRRCHLLRLPPAAPHLTGKRASPASDSLPLLPRV